MNIARRLLTAFIVLLGLPAMAQDAKPQKPRDYTFVFITTGEATDLTPEAQREAFAGPFGPPLAKPDHRGLFVFNAHTLEAGMAHAETDPTYRAGVFKLTGHLMTTSAPLTELHDLDMKAREEQGEPPGANARSYVLATAAYDETLLRHAEKVPGVLIAARLHGSAPDGADQILLWLDAENEDAAKAITGAIKGEWTLHGWFGSKSVVQLKV